MSGQFPRPLPGLLTSMNLTSTAVWGSSGWGLLDIKSKPRLSCSTLYHLPPPVPPHKLSPPELQSSPLLILSPICTISGDLLSRCRKHPGPAMMLDIGDGQIVLLLTLFLRRSSLSFKSSNPIVSRFYAGCDGLRRLTPLPLSPSARSIRFYLTTISSLRLISMWRSMVSISFVLWAFISSRKD